MRFHPPLLTSLAALLLALGPATAADSAAGHAAPAAAPLAPPARAQMGTCARVMWWDCYGSGGDCGDLMKV